jgi:hypothetical protein
MTCTRRGVLAGLTVFWSPVWAVFAVWRALEGAQNPGSSVVSEMGINEMVRRRVGCTARQFV